MNFANTTPIPETGGRPLREVYLERLERVLKLRRRHDDELNPQGIRLLDHSVFAAYCDCRDIGAAAEARELIRAADGELAKQLTMATAPDSAASSGS